MAEISVIVPIYKTEAYLTDCLDSLIAQTFKDFEAILVDDGSPDNSFEIANSYVQKDSRFKIFQQENSGLYSARNTGLKNASGKWITFLDSDDLLDPKFLETLYHLITTSNSQIAVSAHTPFYNKKKLPSNTKKGKSFFLSGPKALHNALFQNNTPDYSAWNKLYSADLWKNKFFAPRKFAEDLATIPDILLNTNRIIVTTQPLYFYRKRKDSLLNTPYNKEKTELLEIAENLLEKISTKDKRLIPAAENTLLSASFSILWKTPDTEEFSDVKKRAYKHILRLRFKSLFDTRTRFRNKAAVLFSLLGKRFLIFALRRFG